MTARRKRRTRPEREDALPAAIIAWFAGESPMPWEALLPGGYERVPDWWATWAEAHPGATPPADAFPWQIPPA